MKGETNNNNNQVIVRNKDDSLLFSTSVIYEQNIDELWIFIKDLNKTTKILDVIDNFYFIRGDNTWNVGNIFSLDLIGLTPLKFKCKKTTQNKDKKIIIWKIKGDIGISFFMKLCLYRITQNDKTLVKSTIWQTEKENEINDYKSTREYFLNLEYNILLKKSNYLNNLKKDIIVYESAIIKTNYLNVWNYIIDFKEGFEIWRLIGNNMEFNNTKIVEGAFLKCYINDLKHTAFFKIIEIKTYKKKKSCKIKFETIGTYADYLVQITEYKINNINDNKTQLSIQYKLKYDINKDFVTNLRNKTKEALKKYKIYFEEQK